MTTEEQNNTKKKEEKKPQIIIKLDWVFGIRKDFLPNVEFLGKDTIVYPASNNIVIFNFARNMGSMNLQHYIQGKPHSKGITTMIAMNCSKKVVGFSEDLKDGIQISFYSITVKQGLKNFPVVQTIYDFKEMDMPKLTHTYCMTYTKSRRTTDYYIVALASDDKEYYFIIWKWDLENVRDKPLVQKIYLHEAKYDEEKEQSKEMSSSVSVSMKEEASENVMNLSNNESNAVPNHKDEPIEVNINNHFELGFPSLENNLFSLVSRHSACFFKITNEGAKEDYRINLVDENGYNDYGNEIYGSNWLNDGPFCFVTDHYINIFDIKEQKLLQKLINPDGEIRIITPFTLTSSYEGFIGGGNNKKFQVYAKKSLEEENVSEREGQEKNSEKYYMAFEKTKYDFVPGVNEKITDDKVLQNEKITSNERPFFL